MRRISASILVAVFATAALSGCLSGTEDAEADQGGDSTPVPATEPVVRFIALGDQGTGDENQQAVADAMETVCAELGCDFAITTGDNIYEVGTTSHYDAQFELKFELPYQDVDFPFYLSLGNHDNLGVRGGHAGGDFQVMYSERTDRMSDKWTMPDRWYVHEQGHVQFLAMDTNFVFDNNTDFPQLANVLSDDVNGEKQMAFVNETLNGPTGATWRILYGHHPIYSNGAHGDTGTPASYVLKEAVCQTGHVDVFIAGHDHDLQWLKAKPEACGSTEFIVSGAAAKTRPLTSEDHEAYFAVGDQLGFWWIEIAGDTFTGKAYDENAELLFERSFTRNETVGL